MITGTEQIAVEYNFLEPPAKLWRALTEPDLLAAWLMPNNIAPVIGHKFSFRTQPMGDWNGIVDCEILDLVLEKKLVYSWRGGSAKNDSSGYKLDTTVTWTLEPTSAGGTLLKLVHEGFHPEDFAFKAMGQGWKSKSGALQNVLGTIS